MYLTVAGPKLNSGVVHSLNGYDVYIVPVIRVYFCMINAANILIEYVNRLIKKLALFFQAIFYDDIYMYMYLRFLKLFMQPFKSTFVSNGWLRVQNF